MAHSPHRQYKGCQLCKPHKNRRNGRAVREPWAVLRQVGKPAEAASYRRQADLWRKLTGLLERARVRENRKARELLRSLGETCEALGRKDEAEAWYGILLALDPLDRDVQRTLYHLRQRPSTS